jgi:adhesin transport system membrane fusion protein
MAAFRKNAVKKQHWHRSAHPRLRSRISAMGAAVEQRRRDYAEAQATVTSLRQSLQLAQNQVNMLAPLAAKSIVPQTELLSAQREVTDIQGRLAAAQQAASRAQAGLPKRRRRRPKPGSSSNRKHLTSAARLRPRLRSTNSR